MTPRQAGRLLKAFILGGVEGVRDFVVCYAVAMTALYVVDLYSNSPFLGDHILITAGVFGGLIGQPLAKDLANLVERAWLRLTWRR